MCRVGVSESIGGQPARALRHALHGGNQPRRQSSRWSSSTPRRSDAHPQPPTDMKFGLPPLAFLKASTQSLVGRAVVVGRVVVGVDDADHHVAHAVQLVVVGNVAVAIPRCPTCRGRSTNCLRTARRRRTAQANNASGRRQPPSAGPARNRGCAAARAAVDDGAKSALNSPERLLGIDAGAKSVTNAAFLMPFFTRPFGHRHATAPA